MEHPDNKPPNADWLGNKKYRVEVDILRALPKGRPQCTDICRCVNGGSEGGSSVDTAT